MIYVNTTLLVELLMYAGVQLAGDRGHDPLLFGMGQWGTLSVVSPPLLKPQYEDVS